MNLDKIAALLAAGVEAVNNLNTTMLAAFPRATGTASTATAGAASALPATPAGYILSTHPETGATIKLPYYNT